MFLSFCTPAIHPVHFGTNLWLCVLPFSEACGREFAYGGVMCTWFIFLVCDLVRALVEFECVW